MRGSEGGGDGRGEEAYPGIRFLGVRLLKNPCLGHCVFFWGGTRVAAGPVAICLGLCGGRRALAPSLTQSAKPITDLRGLALFSDPP